MSDLLCSCVTHCRFVHVLHGKHSSETKHEFMTEEKAVEVQGGRSSALTPFQTLQWIKVGRKQSIVLNNKGKGSSVFLIIFQFPSSFTIQELLLVNVVV